LRMAEPLKTNAKVRVIVGRRAISFKRADSKSGFSRIVSKRSLATYEHGKQRAGGPASIGPALGRGSYSFQDYSRSDRSLRPTKSFQRVAESPGGDFRQIHWTTKAIAKAGRGACSCFNRSLTGECSAQIKGGVEGDGRGGGKGPLFSCKALKNNFFGCKNYR